MTRRRCRLHQRGAALLLAMIILTLVSTLAAGMIWQQWRAIEVETAERARSQAAWILTGALDWARLILREDRTDKDDLSEPWAVPLAEARLSTFLAAERGAASADDDGIEAFLSGSIEDAQSRYNLRRLVAPNQDNKLQIDESEVDALKRLCEIAGLSQQVAVQIANGLFDAMSASAGEAAPVMPNTTAQLAWFGIDRATIERLAPWVTLLPDRRAGINLNTASGEVIAAAVKGVDLGTAQKLVEVRRRSPFNGLPDAKAHLPESVQEAELARVAGVRSSFFVVRGRLRLGDRVLEETSLVQRRGRNNIVVLQRERVNLVESAR